MFVSGDVNELHCSDCGVDVDLERYRRSGLCVECEAEGIIEPKDGGRSWEERMYSFLRDRAA